MEKNIGVYTSPKRDIYVGDAAAPEEPGPDEVLIKMRACGICGSDVHFWKEGHSGPYWVREPLALGHEAAGDVVKLGSNVTSLKVGDRVAVEPEETCGQCERCKSGAYNGCPHVIFKSTPPYQGMLRKYWTHPAKLCYKIDGLTYEEGAMLEPMSVGLAGIEQSGLRLGEPTLVAGAGPIGTLTAMLARAAGAVPLVMTDISGPKLEFAKKMIPGIRTVLVDPKESPESVAEKVEKAAGGKLKRVLECTGFAQSVCAGILASDFRGTVEVLGVSSKDVIDVPFNYQCFNEVTVKGLFRYTNTWPKGIRILREKLIDISPLVSYKIKLEEGDEAFKIAADPSKHSIKTMIVNS